jgi:hypothetical protein
MHKDREKITNLKSDLIKITFVTFVTQIICVIVGNESRNSVGHIFNIPVVSCMPSGNRVYSESPHVSCCQLHFLTE